MSGVRVHARGRGVARAVRRLLGREAVKTMDPLRGEADEPVRLDVTLHPLLADYAAARGQELRGNTAQASGLYAAYERGLAEAAGQGGYGFETWNAL